MSLFIYGQNLILNPSFEETRVDEYGKLYADKWIVPNEGSIDYFSSQFEGLWYKMPNTTYGYHNAYKGNACIGFVLFNWNGEMEHYMAQLSKPLMKDSLYYICIHLKYVGDSVWIFSKQIELLFTSSNKILWRDTDYRSLFSNPNDQLTSSVKVNIETVNKSKDWVELNVFYKAQGGEKYLTFGLFYQGDIFFDLCNKYTKDYKDLKKREKFILKHDIDPIYANRNFKPTIKNSHRVYAYYLLDDVSVELKNEVYDNDFTFPVGSYISH